MKNLQFLVAFLGLLHANVYAIDTAKVNYPYHTLDEAFNAIGFHPENTGNAYFAVAADVHYDTLGSKGMRMIIEEINGLAVPPRFLCIAGDVIRSASLSFGRIPTAMERQHALAEFSLFKKDVSILNDQVKLEVAMGNHDTHPAELDPEIFHEVFPDIPAYHSFKLAGIQFYVLNGHSTGYIDSVQLEWLKKDVRSLDREQSVILFVHQPSMANRVRERGIPAAISAAFENHQGLIWLIGGHEHMNKQTVFNFRKTKLVQHGITTGSTEVWGADEKPGYWIYCLESGSVKARIFKHLFEGYRVEAEPELQKAEQVPKPFDQLENIRWKALVGQDRQFLVNAQASDCLDYWAYVKELVYRIPLNSISGQADFLAVLRSGKMSKIDQPGQYFMSSNLQEWLEVGLHDESHDTLQFSIPDEMRDAENLYFKYVPSDESYVGGFALYSSGT